MDVATASELHIFQFPDSNQQSGMHSIKFVKENLAGTLVTSVWF